MKLILVTGPRNSGKTTRLWSLYRREILQNSVKPGGFLTSPAVPGETKDSYFLENLQTREKREAAAAVPPAGKPGWIHGPGRFWFCGDTYEAAFRVYSLQTALPVLFMDEAGALELAGRGFDRSLELLAKAYKGRLFLGIRDKFIEKILEKYRFREICEEISIIESRENQE